MTATEIDKLSTGALVEFNTGTMRRVVHWSPDSRCAQFVHAHDHARANPRMTTLTASDLRSRAKRIVPEPVTISFTAPVRLPVLDLPPAVQEAMKAPLAWPTDDGSAIRAALETDQPRRDYLPPLTADQTFILRRLRECRDNLWGISLRYNEIGIVLDLIGRQ